MEKERNDADESKKETASETVQSATELNEDESKTSPDPQEPTLPESKTATDDPPEAPDLSELANKTAKETPVTADEPEETTSDDEAQHVPEAEVTQPEPVDEQKSADLPAATTEKTEATADVAEEAAADEQKTTTETDDAKSEAPANSGDQYEEIAFDKLSKDELLRTVAELAELDDPRRAEGISRDVKNAFDVVFQQERTAALEKFVSDGGEESDFEYKHDIDAVKFEEYLKIIKERKAKYYQELERQKDRNLEKKNELLEKLRHIVDGEESTTSINTLKALQAEWKAIGPVPGAQNKTLWANYNALIDRFYDNRSIYFELKELDRKKNLDAKLELCDKAEKLDDEKNIKEAVKQLNELHEEFKHIGPVPKDDQEALWLRFKAASDKIYVKRKGFVDQLKTELKDNMTKKLALGEAAEALLSFDSDRINEWNDKTRELLDLQKKWESIGGLPREHAKEVNKKFWSAFKGFFANKNKFFKSLESMRDENLVKKEELVAKAEALADSTDWHKTAEEFKKLQSQWKEIGPVPEKKRNDVYKRFKAAGDAFFNKRREQTKGADKEFEANLKLKEAICDKLEALAKAKEFDQEEVFKLQDEYGEIGFVPRNAIKKIQKRYDQALEAVTRGADLSDEELSEFKANLSVNKLRGGPNGDRKLNRKEQGVRRRISQLEADLNTWKTNMEFFASSAKADKLKDQVEGRIKEAQAELEALNAELRVLRNS